MDNISWSDYDDSISCSDESVSTRVTHIQFSNLKFASDLKQTKKKNANRIFSVRFAKPQIFVGTKPELLFEKRNDDKAKPWLTNVKKKRQNCKKKIVWLGFQTTRLIVILVLHNDCKVRSSFGLTAYAQHICERT
jgi:hypothetical protein